MLRCAIVVCLVSCALPSRGCPEGGVAPGAWWGASVEAALARAGERAAAWEAALREVPQEQRAGLAFLIEHMPQDDLRTLTSERVLDELDLAYAARAQVPWGPSLPDAVFFNSVLPYCNVSEARHPWRRQFYERFLPLVAECQTPGEAAQLLNREAFKQLGVRYSTQRKRADQSPQESIAQGMASCTGLSIMLTDACRAVAVPARLVGIPRWVNKNGNHTWVEVWDEGWHFTGAAEYSPSGLNKAWFQGDAALALKDSKWNAIYAVSYRKTELVFPLVWSPQAATVYAENVTDRYTGAKKAEAAGMTRLLISVRAVKGGPRLAAAVKVTDTQDSSLLFEGTSRDERFDLNDLLTFHVPRGRTMKIVVTHGGRSQTFERTCQEPQERLDVELGPAPQKR